ncbi:IS4 family transposase [Streptomyces tateyamensis]|uniref:IS4 family transposase n=1 Tax=Streptomyces tateyamensis TaxID=565073 RepID=A0A2V4P265_9ACTN|nr:transposase domain-containing protein [Streptomyces tateyamensis]PYC76804.1 IS4 family transposase [Streptomyces tateyamensis]
MSDFADSAGIGLLVRTYPAELVDSAVAACGRTERRRRVLSARMMVYFVLAMALFSPAPYLDVMRRLTTGLRWGGHWGEQPIPNKASIFQARERLGAGPLHALFRTSVRPLASPDTPQAYWRGRHLLLLQEEQVELPETGGETPRLRIAGLVEQGSGAVLDAVFLTGETPRTLLRSAGPTNLLLVDGQPLDPGLLATATACGVPLVWRLPAVRIVRQGEPCAPDGSFRVRLGHQLLRVVAPDTVTTLLDPGFAPAAELRHLLARGAEQHGALRDALLGAYGRNGPLTSRTSEGVRQEVYGRLLVHYAIRQSMQYACSAPERRGAGRMPEFAR